MNLDFKWILFLHEGMILSGVKSVLNIFMGAPACTGFTGVKIGSSIFIPYCVHLSFCHGNTLFVCLFLSWKHVIVAFVPETPVVKRCFSHCHDT